jgi:hypothetical protein
MWQFFQNLDQSIQTVIISAIVGTIFGLLSTYFKSIFEKTTLRHKLELEYEYSERKKLRKLIGKYHGRILEASERLNHRFWNLHENEAKGWLNVEGIYDNPDSNYYFTTTIYRFLELYCLLRLFTKKAIYIDSRIAKKGELIFLKFFKSFEWVITDVDLFKGLMYDPSRQIDHFFRDKIQLLCESLIENDNIISIEEFYNKLKNDEYQQLLPVLKFFDGLLSAENRLRWDRVISLHLLLMEFINFFGYDIQKSTIKQFLEIANTYKHNEILRNLSLWLPKLGIKNETKEILKIYNILIPHKKSMGKLSS